MSTKNQTSFEDLPKVILKYILSPLSPRDLANFELTSKRISNLLKEREIWKEHFFELFLEEDKKEVEKMCESKKKGTLNWKKMIAEHLEKVGYTITRDSVKIVLMGSGGVGKTSIFDRFISGKFVGDEYDPTIEDSRRKIVKYRGYNVRIEVIDTPGSEQFTAMRDLYIKEGHAFILVYSIIARSTFRDLSECYLDVIYNVKKTTNVPIVLVGNKVDLEEQRVTTREEGQQFASKYGIPYMETSAKTDVNIEEAFTETLRQVWKMPIKLSNLVDQRKEKKCHLF